MQSNLFELVYCLTLASRPDRWQAFRSRLPRDWPFAEPIRVRAVDGRLAPPPAWWRSGPGAWGCYRSHLSILEDCLNKRIESVLLLEDDAIFVPDFREKVEEFFSHLPDDWSFVYLGGEHLKQNVRLPRRINDWVYRPFNVNRTHCFGLRGRPTMELAYRHLNAFTSWTAEHHIDHQLGELHAAMERGLYVPRYWLVNQAGGHSDVNGKEWPSLEFSGAEALTRPPVDLAMVAVVGPYCSGTSCVAGMLHHAGISMGSAFAPNTAGDPFGCHEAEGLGLLCRAMYREPWLAEDSCREDRTALLRKWAGERCNQLRGHSRFAGGNHPINCLLGPELLEAWNRPFFLVVDRAVEDSIESVMRADWNWPREAVHSILPHMVEKRDAFLREFSPPHMRISYESLVARPDLELDRICRALHYSPSDHQRRKATDFASKWVMAQRPQPTPIPIHSERLTTQSSNSSATAPFIACLGLHRSGSSCVAGILHRLGLHMGNRFVGCEADGGYEAEGLASICERYMPFPEIHKCMDELATTTLLAEWIRAKSSEAASRTTIAGGKYPHLLAMGEMLLRVCGPSLYIVHCERPLSESVASLIRRDGRSHTNAQLEAVQRYLWDEKLRLLSRPELKIHSVNYHALLTDPVEEIRKLAHFLPLTISETQITIAAQYVRPTLRHIALAS
ncbi:MAG TPA: glycosyltransferase family 25 protein [Pirellulales bacterium]